MNPSPTLRQQQVLDYIDCFIKALGFAPTTHEIAEAFDFGQNAAMGHLRALQRKGRVTWEEGKSRTLRIVK